MANTQALCNTFKRDLMNGIHAFGTSVVRAATTKDSFKAALYLTTATVDKTTTAYTVTGELTGTNYTAGGNAVTNATVPALDVDKAHWTPSASLSWTNITSSANFDAALIYNDTATGKNSVGVYTFGSQSVTAGNFTVNMPTNDGTTGFIRLA